MAELVSEKPENTRLADLLSLTDNEEQHIHFIVEDSPTTNNSVVFLSRTMMNNRRIWSGVAILLKGEKGRKTALTVLSEDDDNLAQNKIRLNATVRSKLGVTIGDFVTLGKFIDINYAKKISVRPVSVLRGNSIDLNSTDFDLLERDNLLETYLWPYLFKAYRPVHQGDTFIVDVTGGGKKIKFKVVETNPAPFCIVAPGTTIEVILEADASVVRTLSDSIQVNQPSEESICTSRPSTKRKPEGRRVLVESKRSKGDSKTKPNTIIKKIKNTTIIDENDVNCVNSARDDSSSNLQLKLHFKTVGALSPQTRIQEIHSLAQNLSEINALMIEYKSYFVNPLGSQLESWSNKFHKLEYGLNKYGFGNTDQTEKYFCELLKDSAPQQLASHFLKTQEYNQTLKISQVMLRQQLIFFGIKCDTIFNWLCKKGISLAGIHQPIDALQLLQTFEKKQSEIPSYDQDKISKVKYRIGIVLQKQNDYFQALPILHKVHEQQLSSLGPNNSDTVVTNFQIGVCLTHLRRDEEALTIFQSVYEKRNAFSGPSHKDTLGVQDHIVYTLRKRKRYDDALTILEKVYKVKVDTFGPEHPETLVTQRCIRNCIDLKLMREKISPRVTTN